MSLTAAFRRAVTNEAPIRYVPRAQTGMSASLFGSSATSQMANQLAQPERVGTLYAVIDALRTRTAAVEWHLYRTHDNRGKLSGVEDRREVENHAALQVWQKPTPWHTRTDLMETVQQHLDLTGEGYLIPVWPTVRGRRFTGAGPTEIWHVRPDWVTPVPGAASFLAGWVVTGPDGQATPFEPDEIHQLRYPNPRDPYRGLGPVQSILTDLDSARYSREWNRNFFRNSAEPGGIVEVPKNLSDVEFRTLRDRWNEQHKGVENAHRVAILEVAKWVDRSFNQREMQFVELVNVSRDIIREAFGISKTMIGQTEDVNRATAEAATFVFADQILEPRLERWKRWLNSRYLPLFGDTARGLEFDYESPVPDAPEQVIADRDSKVQAVVGLVSAGFDPGAVLEAVGLPDITHGSAGGANVTGFVEAARSMYLGTQGRALYTAEEGRRILSEAFGVPLDGDLPPAPAGQEPAEPFVPKQGTGGDDEATAKLREVVAGMVRAMGAPGSAP